jgi:hypothetical protein
VRITREIAAKVLAVVDKGLSDGLGDPTPGKMCIEAAVCYALGEPHRDDPSCVDDDVRAFKIVLNDCGGWANNKARARGMRRLAIAQLGSNTIEKARQFEQLVADSALRRMSGPLVEEIIKHGDGDAKACLTRLVNFSIEGVGGDFEQFVCSVIDSGIKDANLLLADIGLQALIKLKSPGVKFLGLCDIKKDKKR